MSLACPSIVLGAPSVVPSTDAVERNVHVVCAKPTKIVEEIDIDDLITSLEHIDGFSTEMASARAWLAEDLPKDLTSIRLSRGLSQAQLARLVGLRQPNISAIESGIRKPEYETVRKLSIALEVSMDDMYVALESGKAET